MMYEDEEFKSQKGGSVSREDELLMKRFFAHSGRKSSSLMRTRQAARIRFHNYRNYIGDGGKPEAIVKVVSAKKSVSSVHALVKYVVREEEEKGIELFDQFGFPTTKDQVKLWGLPTDTENKRDNGSFRNNLVWHLVCSIQKEEGAELNDTVKKLEIAVRGFVAEAFACHYYHVIWVLHDDTQEHPHAHLIIKAKPDRGNRLHFDRTGEMIDILRDCFANSLKQAGLDYVATRREDRHYVRRKIINDEDVLRPEVPRGGKHVVGPLIIDLSSKTEPQKKKMFSFDREERFEVPPLFERLFQNSDAAYKNWIWAIEHPAFKDQRNESYHFGVWGLIHRPHLFGPIKDVTVKPKSVDEVVNAFAEIELPCWPKNWQPSLRLKKRKRHDKEKMLQSFSAMFRNAVSDPIERLILMKREWSDLDYEIIRASQKRIEKQGPVKSSTRKGWSL